MNKAISITVKAIDIATAPLRGIMKGILGVAEAGNAAAARTAAATQRIASGMNAVRAVVASSTAAFVAFKAVADMNNTARELQAIGNMATDMGMTAEAISTLKYQAKLSNAAFEGVAAGMKQFNKEMGEFRQKGKSEGMTGLRQLGISAFDAQGRLRSLESMLPDLAEKFEGLTDPVARTTIATNLFGKQGLEMVRVLGQGKERLAALAEENKRLGGLFTDKQVAAANAYMDALDRIKTAWTGLKVMLIEKIGPLLAEAMTSFASIVASVPELIARVWEVATKVGTDPEITRQFAETVLSIHNLIDVALESIKQSVYSLFMTILDRGPALVEDAVWLAVKTAKYAMLWLSREFLVNYQDTVASIWEMTIGLIEGIKAVWNTSFFGSVMDNFYNVWASTYNKVIGITIAFAVSVWDAFKAPFVMMEKQLAKVDKAIQAVMNMDNMDWGTAVKALGDAFSGAITAPFEAMSTQYANVTQNFGEWANKEYIPLIKQVSVDAGTNASTEFWKAFTDAAAVAKQSSSHIASTMTEVGNAVQFKMKDLAGEMSDDAKNLWADIGQAFGKDSLFVTTMSDGMQKVRLEASSVIDMMDKLFKVSEIYKRHKIELPPAIKPDDPRKPDINVQSKAITEWDNGRFIEGIGIGFNRFVNEANNAMEIGVRFAETVGNSLTNNITTGIMDVIQRVKSIADAFKATAAAVLNEIAKMITQMLVMRAIAGIFGAFGGGSFSGGTTTIPGLTTVSKAQGGPIHPRPWGMANGGVSGAVPGANHLSRDMVHALLMPGEHVMTRQGVRTAGRDRLDGYNQGRAPREESGNSISVTINQTFSGKMDEDGRRQSAAETKRAVLEAVIEALALHPGGRDRMRRALA